MTLAIVIAYLAAVLVVGLASQRFARGSGGEDFFVASRSIGAFVLLMTLFGTHMTSFALLGASGEAYRVGVGVYSLMASSSAILAPLLFLFVGTRVWQLGRRFGYVTQVQYVRDRWGADVPGLFLFVILVLLMIPYLLIGVMGGGLTLTQITDGAVPGWVGSLMIATVVLSYVSFGGLRGTAWVNTFQTSLFMVLGGLTAVVIIRSLGGVGIAVERLQTEAPELLIRGDRVSEIRMLSYTLIPASVGMFPHIFMHWLSARSAQTFRAPVIFYPLCIAAVWIPSVLLGLFGNLDFPGLEGPAANSVLVRMIALHAPEALAGLLGAGVFAAIMSSLDSQSLSLGTMFAHDVVGHYRLGGDLGEERRVRIGRIFVVLIIGVTFALSLVTSRSIFGLAVWSFTGYSALLPVLLAGLFWKRSTAAGVLAAEVVVVVLWLYFFLDAGGRPDYSVGGTGVMPVVVLFAASSLAVVLGSLMTRAPETDRLERFFGRQT
ncbi:MAG: sodium:solute symporter family protein [Acidobacteriota bacterium]